MLEALAAHADAGVLAAVGANPSCPPGLFARIVRHEDPDVRKGAASNPNAGPDTLATLAEDEASIVRAHVASNMRCPFEVLTELVKEGAGRVLSAAGENPKCPPEALAELASSPDFEDKNAAACNPSTPSGVLVELAQDVFEEGGMSSWDEDEQDDENAEFHAHVLWLVAQNPNCPLPTLITLSADQDSDVRDGALATLATLQPPQRWASAAKMSHAV